MPPTHATGYNNFVRKYENLKSVTNPNPVLTRQIQQATDAIHDRTEEGLTYYGDIGVDVRNIIVKPKAPDWLYRPIFGRPRTLNIPEVRRLSDTPTAAMCIKTICDEVASIPWNIRMKDPEQSANEAAIDEVTDRLENPNRNQEDLKIIIKKVLRDILCVDAGVIAKIYDRASYEQADPNKRLLPLGRRHMAEFYAVDGGTFTMNPNKNGILPDQCAYYQYNFHHYSMPIPFARDEIIYMTENPRTNKIYGLSPMEMAYDVIRYEVFGVTAGIDHFTRNQVPKGIVSLLDANTDHIREFKARLEDRVNIQDGRSDEQRWVSSNVPVTNQDVKFTSLQLTPETVRLLETQQWYIKLIFACFGVTPSELGFTDDSNRATDVVQSEVFRRKAIIPKLDLLEYYFNRELVPEFGYDDLWFEFVRKDIQTELREQKLWESWLKNKQRTVNEWRSEHADLDPVAWGDEPNQSSGGFGEGGFNSLFEEDSKESDEGVRGD